MPRDGLRTELLGLAASDPTVIVEIIIACIAKHPQLEATIVQRHLRGNLATRHQAANPRRALPKAKDATVSAVLGLCQSVTAKKLVKHKLLIIDGIWVDVSVKPRDSAVIVGANVVSLAGVASMVEALGGDPESALMRISDAIVSNLSGPVSKRAMTRLDGSTRPLSPPAIETHRDPPDGSAPTEDPAAEVIQVLAAMWSPAATTRQEKGETMAAFLARLVDMAKRVADKDAAAASALEALRLDFPDSVPRD